MTPVVGKRLSLLFISTGGACRAIVAQVLALRMGGGVIQVAATALEGQTEALSEEVLQALGAERQEINYLPYVSDAMAQADLVVMMDEWGGTRRLVVPSGAGRIDWFLPSVRGQDRQSALALTAEVVRHKVAALLGELGVHALWPGGAERAPAI